MSTGPLHGFLDAISSFGGFEPIAFAVATYTVVVAALKLFLHLRNSGWFKWLRFCDNPVRFFKSFLTLKAYFPGDSYVSNIPETEKQFYAEFSKRLRQGKHAIYNCGDGFNMNAPRDKGGEPTSGEKADKLDGAIIEAMRKNPELIYKRFQISSACNLNWISRMIAMKREFGNQFLVYINREFDHMGCFCAIDPEQSNCVFEWQLVSGRHYMRGTLSKGFGFTYGNQAICRTVSTMFDEIASDKSTNCLIADPTKNPMTVDRLRMLQKQLWNDRVVKIHDNPDYKTGDPEIVNAFNERGLNRRDFALDEMDFRERDFPEIPYAIERKGQ